MFFDVDMKGLTFIVSVTRVKLSRITLHLLFVVSDHLWMFCVLLVIPDFSRSCCCLKMLSVGILS